MTDDSMSAEKLAELAAGLTRAQRQALLSARETPLMNRMKCAGRVKALRDAGLTVQAWRGGDLLTPLGESLRALLATRPSGGGE